MRKELKIKYIKSIINSPNYLSKRLDEMNNIIQDWIINLECAHIKAERDCYYKMIDMYFKRYQYYIDHYPIKLH